MAYQDAFEQFLGELGREVGISDLQFDENRFCHITVDDEFPVSLRCDVEEHRFIILGQIVSDLPDVMNRELIELLLEQGQGPLCDNGIGIAFERSTRNLILYQFIPLATLNLERMKTILHKFFEAVKTWRKRLAYPASDKSVSRSLDSALISPYGYL
ncbi:CesT family type III secretion system chaperone [Paraburkholderia sediminicola]|uniref:CesT family type III secretion system chaperone n=1 Tax=Paraburkholderia sediminicola TaxID=458836 RepID=UPI0038BCDDF8